jgi:GDSL-like lipase/acylhydrolase family protein
LGGFKSLSVLCNPSVPRWVPIRATHPSPTPKNDGNHLLSKMNVAHSFVQWKPTMAHRILSGTFCIALTLTAGISSIGFAQAPHYVGALGDSLTDEYFEQDLPDMILPVRQYDYAKNWFELIVTSGKADGGQLAVGTWGEPRRTGYEYNFARWAEVSSALTGQVDAMQSEFTPSSPGLGPENHFVGVCIGANDFFPDTESSSNYKNFYDWWAFIDFDTQVKPIVDASLAMTDAALDDALGSGFNVVLATIPDYGIAPYTYNTAWGAGYDDGTKREHIDFVVSYVNAELAAFAQNKGIPLVDIYGFTKEVFGDNTDADAMDPSVTKQLGGVDLALHVPDMLTGGTTGEPTNPYAAWVHDGIHPHTTVQGVFANLYMEASNLRYGTNFVLFSEEEILANAGLAYGGHDTLFDELGSNFNSYRDFITLPTNPDAPDIDQDGDIDGADFLILQREYGTLYNQDDLNDWQVNYGTTTSSVVAASTNIPEPNSIVLFLAAFTCGLRWQRRT